MSSMLTSHLSKRNGFRKVIFDSKGTADYQIKCSLARITAKQHLPNSVREGAFIGGAVGGVIISFVKSKAIVSIALTDIKVYDKNMNLILELESFARDFEDEFKVDNNCWCSYENIKDKLKIYYSEFAKQIEVELSKLEKN